MEQGFSYFADHQPPLSDMVQRGRLEFLAQFPSLTSPEISDRLPVPNDEEAFRACRLDWRATPAGDQARALYTDLIALRHTDPVLSALGTMDVAVESAAPTPEIVLLRYSGRDQSRAVDAVLHEPSAVCPRRRASVGAILLQRAIQIRGPRVP